MSNFNKIMTFYQKKDNKRLLRTYGAQLYNHSLESDKENFELKNNIIDKKVRMRLVNWMFEVFDVMKCAEPTAYLTIHLFDYYSLKLNNDMNTENIHMLAVTCLFIASKFEDLSPISMNDVIYRITHKKFNESLIKKLEKSILNITDFNVLVSSSYDFIKTLYCEFRITNKFFFNSPSELNEYFHLMEKYSLYISKIILHFNDFFIYKNSMKAICCIIISYEVVKTIIYLQNNEEIMKKWILSLIENSGFDPNVISELYNRINECYKNFHILIPNSNLMNLTDLSFNHSMS